MDVALSLLTAVAGGLIGAGITHYFARRRDIASKRREIILTNLLEALEDFDRSNAHRHDADLKRLERAIYKIYVFGDRELVGMTRKMVDEFVSTRTADTTEVMLALRNRVRAELALAPIADAFQFLTIEPGTKSKAASE